MTTTAISAAVPRSRVTLAGEVVAVAAFVRPWARLDVELCDGTGTITLRFMGRAEIPGIAPGRRIRIEGTPAIDRGSLVILNPLYTFTGDDVRGTCLEES
jgi:hypothetical protein